MEKCMICNSDQALPRTGQVRMTAVTDDGPDLRMEINQAHLRILDMSVHLLGYVNAFRALSELPDYLGRGRTRYAMVLVMLDELASLMELMKECENCVTDHIPEVYIEGYFSPLRKQERMERVLEEIGKSEALFFKVKKNLGREPSAIDFTFFKDQFLRTEGSLFPLVEKVLRYDWRCDGEELPSEEDIEMLFTAIELNVRGAAEFSYQWAMANEYDIDFKLETLYSKDGRDRRKEKGYWVIKPL
ncbi:MAG: hypothetical protein JXA45_00810 [Methanomassiliicoccales archaeon]|nr:hypothetical protein [Methanomassiliicoccales archaeon]